MSVTGPVSQVFIHAIWAKTLGIILGFMMEKRDFLREQAVVSLGSVHISKILVPTVGWMV